MSLSKKLADLKKQVEDRNQGFDGGSPFVKLEDKESITIRFIQEFDDDSSFYDDRRGTIQVVEEHSSPKDFKLKAVCTYEDTGRCWACEQASMGGELGKKWRSKLRFYANVIVRGNDGDKVKIYLGGFSKQGIGQNLIEMAEEYGGLGGVDFKLTRKGSGFNDTSYLVTPKAPKPMSKEDQALEVIDLRKFIKHIPYESQAQFYNGELEDGGKAEDWVSN